MKKPSLAVTLLVVLALASTFAIGIEKEPDYVFPRIEGYGKVVKLADAAEQPRHGARICVDLTAPGPVDAVNPGLEKTARYVNIYAGAGRESAECSLTVVLHGAATDVALSDAAYAKHLGEAQNPNLPLLAKLRDAGVEFFVCGQAMTGKGYVAAEIDEQVTVAVSALTVNVNRQADGYAYIPLH